MKTNKKQAEELENVYVPAKWEKKFLELYRKSCNVTLSAQGVKITRDAVYQRRKAYPEFAAIMDTVKDEAIEILEGIGWQRAQRQSDTLLIFFLKANRPEKYKETQRHELSNPDGTNLAMPVVYLPEVKPIPDEMEGD